MTGNSTREPTSRRIRMESGCPSPRPRRVDPALKEWNKARDDAAEALKAAILQQAESKDGP